MKTLILSCLWMFIETNSTYSFHTLELELVRKNYITAVQNKETCKNMIKQLDDQADKNSIYLGYLGAYQIIWAKHTLSPIAKLSTFNKGKKNLEKAIVQSSDEVELRFLRLSVQTNCPDFLRYKDSIAKDKAILTKHVNNIKSNTLKHMALSLLND